LIESKGDLIQNPPLVRVQIQLTESGLLQIDDAHIIINLDSKKPPSIAGKLMNFFGNKEKVFVVNLLVY
jgi:hypothetical protein